MILLTALGRCRGFTETIRQDATDSDTIGDAEDMLDVIDEAILHATAEAKALSEDID